MLKNKTIFEYACQWSKAAGLLGAKYLEYTPAGYICALFLREQPFNIKVHIDSNSLQQAAAMLHTREIQVLNLAGKALPIALGYSYLPREMRDNKLVTKTEKDKKNMRRCGKMLGRRVRRWLISLTMCQH